MIEIACGHITVTLPSVDHQHRQSRLRWAPSRAAPAAALEMKARLEGVRAVTAIAVRRAASSRCAPAPKRREPNRPETLPNGQTL